MHINKDFWRTDENLAGGVKARVSACVRGRIGHVGQEPQARWLASVRAEQFLAFSMAM